MKTNMYKPFMLAFLASLLTSVLAVADYRDYNSKAWNSGWKGSSNRTTARSSRNYVRSVPSVAKAESAPTQVAQAPSAERTFSYDPAQAAKEATPAAPCHAAANVTPPAPQKAVENPAPKSAEKPKTTSTRSYSYEPDMAPASVPVTRSYGSSSGRRSSGGGFSIDRAMRAKGY